MKPLNVGILIILIFLISFPAPSVGQISEITGTIKDIETGLPLEGANIVLFETNIGTTSNADGKYVLKNVSRGKQFISVSFLGYKIEKKEIQITQSNTQINFLLTPIVLKGQEVMITASRAKVRETPVAFTNISRKELKQNYWAQDIPVLLSTVPNVYAYSDAGNGIGYSYLKIRGFDQKRISVMINGIEHNDPEEHSMYWIDLPDLAASVQDIQIQRGVGSSLYGSSSFGGAVNVITSELSNERSMNITTGMGSYNTRKFNTQFNSGLVNNSYAVSGRFSKITTDGYRDRSAVDLWSYFISAARYGLNTTTRINIYGGPEVTHAAWDGSSEADLGKNHQHNSITYPNTIDNFSQPHYELLHEWQINEKIELSNTFFYIHGKGYYETLKYGQDLIDFGYPYFERESELITETDLIRQKWVEKDQVGWIPKLTFNHNKGVLTFGGNFYLYKSDHWGNVLWANNLPPDAVPNHTYHQYFGDKNSAIGFIHELYRLTKRIQLMADLNVQYKTYQFEQQPVGSFLGENRHKFDVDYLFFNPKFGINYNPNQKWNVFGNFSIANLEPSDTDLYDIWKGPDDLGVPPLFKNSKSIYQNGNISYIEWSDPFVQPERVYDFELGAGYHSDNFRFKLNGYYMNFTNEIVSYSQIGDEGEPIKGNAESTVHRGIEAELAFVQPIGKGFTVSLNSNLTLSQNYFNKFNQYEAIYDENWNFVGTQTINYNSKTIAGFPTNQGLFRLTLQGHGMLTYFQWQSIGKQYLDNSENENRNISPFDVATLHVSYDLKNLIGLRGIKVNLWINNLFNNKYEMAGYYDSWAGSNFYYPAARRNFYLGLTTSL